MRMNIITKMIDIMAKTIVLLVFGRICRVH